MKIREMQEMYDFNYWVNDRILSMAEQVTPEQFDAPTAHSFGTLHATLVHIMDVEWFYRMMYKGGDLPEHELKPADFPTIAAVRQRWQEEEEAMRGYLASLSDDDLDGLISLPSKSATPPKRKLWQLLYDVVNHGTQHRSEAANMLTLYGHSPGGLDFSVYLHERETSEAGHLTN